MRRPRKRWQLPRRCRCPRTGHALAARPRPSGSRAGAWAERADTPGHEMLDGLDREPDWVAGEVIAEEIQTPLSHWPTGPRCVREFAHRDVFVSMLES